MNTPLPSVLSADKVMDVRAIPCSVKHALENAVDKVTDALKGHNSNDRRN